jgi:hypothetical protein
VGSNSRVSRCSSIPGSHPILLPSHNATLTVHACYLISNAECITSAFGMAIAILRLGIDFQGRLCLARLIIRTEQRISAVERQLSKQKLVP